MDRSRQDPFEGLTQSEAARLSSYVDPAVLQELIRPNTAGAREVAAEDLAILFADIRGFTAFSQKVSPALLVPLLDEFLDLTARCIHRYHGVIDKFMGDCVMAYWRTDGADGDAALYRACQAALDLQSAARTFSAHVLERTGSELGVGVGIHAGPALVCHVGTQEYMAYTAIGSSVNTARRLEEYALPGLIYISEEAAGRLDGRILTEPAQTLQRRRGRDISVSMVKLVGLAPEP